MDKTFNFGEILTLLMDENKINNKQLADDLGVHVVTIQNWRRNELLLLSKLLKLADYFNCSLDYLTGRTETKLDYIPRKCPPFYQRIREVIKENGITLYRIDKETKIKDSYFTDWKKGTEPHVLTLVEAANYLGVTIDYLVGRDR